MSLRELIEFGQRDGESGSPGSW